MSQIETLLGCPAQGGGGEECWVTLRWPMPSAQPGVISQDTRRTTPAPLNESEILEMCLIWATHDLF